MPVNIPNKLPAIETLRRENIFVMDSERASNQDIRPLKLVILNLMPLKIITETDLIRLISNTPLQIEIDFLQMASHTSTHTPIEHLMAFYKTFDVVKKSNYDGLIITGAPVELLDFEEVNYWEELKEIFDWAKVHVTSTMYICWAAQAGLYYHYGIPKHTLEKKMFGVFKQNVINPLNPIFRGFDESFYVPHSRYTEIRAEDILNKPELVLLSDSPESGVCMVMGRNGREFFLTGHSEYSPLTLGEEYKRDIEKGLDTDLPINYFRNDNPNEQPLVRWRAHANLLFSNWLNYFVYQKTPYDLKKIK